MTNLAMDTTPIASINGVALHAPGASLTVDELRQRACTELLRQTAIQRGLLASDDLPDMDGVVSEAASAAIEVLLDQEIMVPEPTEEACRRHHAANQARYSTGERVKARHILFAVTPGVDLNALRQQAESTLLNLRCFNGTSNDDAFVSAASTLSNCPSGALGGDLGWLLACDCAPEFSSALFGNKEVGVLPRLVHSRFGLHVVEVLQREHGVEPPFESVRGAVATLLRQKNYVSALQQCLRDLEEQATVVGVDIARTATPLVQ